MADGWIKIHRKINNTEIWNEKRRFSKFEAWMDILMSANYEDKFWLDGYKKILVKNGSFVTSKVKLSKKWGVSRTTVNNYLNYFITQKMITTNCTTKYTIITVDNWGLYQIQEQRTRQ